MADAVSTKQALAKGLKATLEHKSLDRVTVGDITTFCGLNRQTFYYHFEDKYALLNWIYYTELMLPLAEGAAPEDWPRRVARMLDRMREEGAFYRRALRGEGQRGFEALLTAMVRELAAGLLEQADRPGETADKAFLASFFAYGVTGMVTAWVQDGMKEPPEQAAARWQALLDQLPADAPRGIEFPLEGPDLTAVTRHYVNLLREE